jgi:hypothetical protein
MEIVVERKFTQGILIYAVDQLFEDLKKEEGITVVNENIGHDLL